MAMNPIRPFILRMTQAGIIGNGRFLGTHIIGSQRGKVRDPHIGINYLRKQSFNYSEEVKDFVAENVADRIMRNKIKLSDLQGFSQYALAKVIADGRYISKEEQQFIWEHIMKMPKEEVAHYSHNRQMLINLTSYPMFNDIPLALEAYKRLEPVMTDKMMMDVMKKGPVDVVFQFVIKDPRSGKARDREAVAHMLAIFINMNNITFGSFNDEQLQKVSDFVRPWLIMRRAMLDEYAKVDKKLAELLSEKLPHPEPRTKPGGIGPINIA